MAAYVYYPGTNLIQTITDSNNIVQAVYTDYEPTGKIGQIFYRNGIYTLYNYDDWSTKLFGIVTTNNPANTDPTLDLQNREYTYSRAGDILQIKDNAKGITYDYAYDRLHRLVSEKLSGVNAPIVTRVETITLDYTGTGPVHGVKQITLNGVSRTCAYDPNGNMVTSPDFTNATNPLNRAITYDADNMPTRIVHANGATVDFVYDGVAKRTKKLVQSGKTVLYLGDHFEVENGVNIKYIFGGNLRLAQIKGSLTSYFHKDHLNSTAVVTGEDGLKKESTTYEPFGSTRTHEGTDVSFYKFTDQELDNETNLYNYDVRLYDPVLGMFVLPDSIVQDEYDPQILNRYSYCRNNPLIYTDPSGHKVTIEVWRDFGVGRSIPGTFRAASNLTNQEVTGATVEWSPFGGGYPLAKAGEYTASIRTDHNPNRVETNVNQNWAGRAMTFHQMHNGNTVGKLTGCIAVGIATADPEFVGNSINKLNEIVNLVKADIEAQIEINAQNGSGVDAKLKGVELFSFSLAQIEVKIIETGGFKEYIGHMNKEVDQIRENYRNIPREDGFI